MEHQLLFENAKLTIESFKIPGGRLITTFHHEWHSMNTVFVPDVMKNVAGNHVDYEKAYRFLHPEEFPDENVG